MPKNTGLKKKIQERKEKGIDAIDEKILKVLVECGEFISTKEVARKSGISWNTADGHLHKLYNKGIINHENLGARIDLWEAHI